jgi:hypothetical protein
MHHELNPFVPEHAPDRRFVAKVRLVEGDSRGHGGPVAIDKIVEDDRSVAGEQKLPHAMTSDVTGAANDEDVHG